MLLGCQGMAFGRLTPCSPIWLACLCTYPIAGMASENGKVIAHGCTSQVKLRLFARVCVKTSSTSKCANAGPVIPYIYWSLADAGRDMCRSTAAFTCIPVFLLCPLPHAICGHTFSTSQAYAEHWDYKTPQGVSSVQFLVQLPADLARKILHVCRYNNQSFN